MKYIQTIVTITPYQQEAADILSALMGGLGYESFVDTDNGIEAYIPVAMFDETTLQTLQIPFGEFNLSFSNTTIADKNWNEEWEKNYFHPIAVANQVLVRSPFHKDYPSLPTEIIIAPKMAFGTGHHATTTMMIEHILEVDVTGKRVLDMGCGTGILGILASMRGAKEVVGIDIDQWCVDNSEENCTLNNIQNMSILQGTASTLATMDNFDLILANINRNILLEDLPTYYNRLKTGGLIILSGFYDIDKPIIDACANKHLLTSVSVKENNQWTAVAYEKVN
ncbi:50S ribosomal protein L11 methyltransferase [Geofilum sp. OHC36d9]|uniref:50S ribosomal protein L11 methyltransferase n=1 Tax=Geofilum sp. OHC36d9 TaxID=3458413 RepID=UPI004033D664